MPPTLIGVALGIFLVDAISPELFRKVAGGLAFIFVLDSLRKHFAKQEETLPLHAGNNYLGMGAGLLGGAASSVAHAGGVVWSTYLTKRQLGKEEFVATIIFMFLVTNIIKTASFLHIGIISPQNVLHILMCSPLIILGGLCGNRINKKINVRVFRLIVILLIMILSLQMILR
jgi:uncharacterized membrane protein YfcA